MVSISNNGSKKVLILIFVVALISSGCLIRTYNVVKERPDQEVSGNQGYLIGNSPQTKERQIKTRKTYVMEVEIGKHTAPQEEDSKKNIVQAEDSSNTVVVGREYGLERSAKESSESKSNQSKKYVVRQGDTLEKIAARPEIYGNKKKWYKIYKANKDKIKSPDKILPGQVLLIPE